MILAASLRHKGRSLAQIARDEIGPVSGGMGIVAILFIVVVSLAGLGAVVVKALGGDEVAMQAGSRIVLPANEKAAPGDAQNTVRLPANTRLFVSTVLKSDVNSGERKVLEKEFPLSFAQDAEFNLADDASAKDAQAILATGNGGEIKLAREARLLVPGSSWGVFTIGASIPIALLMGLWMYVLRKNAPTRIVEASVIGVVLLLTCVHLGHYVPGTSLGAMLNPLSRRQASSSPWRCTGSWPRCCRCGCCSAHAIIFPAT